MLESPNGIHNRASPPEDPRVYRWLPLMPGKKATLERPGRTVKAASNVACCRSGLITVTLRAPVGTPFSTVMLATICVAVREMYVIAKSARFPLKDNVEVGWKLLPLTMK